MSEPNILKLQLNITDNSISSIAGLTEGIEWTADQDKYTVQLQAPEKNKFDNIAFIIKDGNDNFKELFELTDQKDGTWQGTSNLLEKVKGGTKIKAGVRYTLNENKFYTSPIEVSIKESIDDTGKTEIENLPPDFNSILTILTKFDDAKAVDNIKTAKFSELKSSCNIPDGILQPDDNVYCLFVRYKGDTKYTYTGIISLTPIELGLIQDYTGTKEEDGTGGGGKVGFGTKLGYSDDGGDKRGFAGGRRARANNGAALGCGAVATDGFAAGPYAQSSRSNIALGHSADATGKQYGAVAIGTSAKIENCENTIVIGKRNHAVNSPYGVIIGSYTKLNNGQYKEEAETYVENSRYPIAIGTSITMKNVNEAIVVGNNIKAEPLKYENGDVAQCKENITIGYSSFANERGCIAIGANVYAGCYKDGEDKIQPGYKTPSSTEPAAIAVGRGSKAVGHASIAIGKYALATRYNSIAIGQDAEAGPVLKDFVQAEAFDKDNEDGRSAVAIGYAAKAKAPGAIQLGKGTNTSPSSLQFRNVTVVKDGAVQFDLSGKGAQNTLPVSKGGTGGTTKATARHGIGIFTGGKTFSEPLKDFKGDKNTGKDITINYANYKFKSPPKLFFNLRFAKDNTSPVLFNYYVKEITATKVTLRVDYWAQTWDTSKKNSKLNFAFDVLAIGDGVKP